jgi:hypothetical protein
MGFPPVPAVPPAFTQTREISGPASREIPAVAPPMPAAPASMVDAGQRLAEGESLSKKPSSNVPLFIGALLVALLAGAGAWYVFRAKPVLEKPPPQVANPAPVNPPARPAQSEIPAASEAVSRPPKSARAAKPRPTPSASKVSASPQAAQIANLQNLAREAYARGSYADPPDTSAIAYSQRVLAMNSVDDYSKKLLENSVLGGKYQVQQAITKKDFLTAHRVSTALALLLPGRSDVAGLQEDIASAEKAAEAASNPKPAALAVSFQVYHMHSDKAPVDKGRYCLGTLSVSAQHMTFAGVSASDGQVHHLVFECADIRETKKNAHVASKQGGFHVRTSSANFNFAPTDPAAAVVPSLVSACSK